MKKILNIFMIVALALSATGCATLLKGDMERVYFSSNPDSAEVYVNDTYKGTTPLQLNLPSKGIYNIEFRKDGYRSKTVVIDNKIGEGWILLDALTGLVPVLVDAVTGNWIQLSTNNVNAVLDQQVNL